MLEVKKGEFAKKLEKPYDSYNDVLQTLQDFAQFGTGGDKDNRFEIHEMSLKLRGQVMILRNAYNKGGDKSTSDLLSKTSLFTATMNEMVQNGFYPSAHVQVRIDELFSGEDANDYSKYFNDIVTAKSEEEREYYSKALQTHFFVVEKIDFRRIVCINAFILALNASGKANGVCICGKKTTSEAKLMPICGCPVH